MPGPSYSSTLAAGNEKRGGEKGTMINRASPPPPPIIDILMPIGRIKKRAQSGSPHTSQRLLAQKWDVISPADTALHVGAMTMNGRCCCCFVPLKCSPPPSSAVITSRLLLLLCDGSGGQLCCKKSLLSLQNNYATIPLLFSPPLFH